MKQSFELEFYLNGEVIDTKEFETAPYVPGIGENMYLSCENPSMDEYGPYYKVIDVMSLFFAGEKSKQKILLKIQNIDKPDW